jgi:RNA polymerase sigma factor (sigma-70 family)
LEKINTDISVLTDHLFRTESKKMVAVLTKIFGTNNIQMAEDVVQDTLIQAINTWKLKGIPDQPKAWLYRVAKNKAIDILRKNKYAVNHDFTSQDALLKSEYTLQNAVDQYWNESVLEDHLLQMMFACCHPGLSVENQITLILKSLCSFSTSEAAKALLTNEETISKRLYRTKEFFKEHKIKLEPPLAEEIESKLEIVLKTIYLVFNEGYNSTHNERLIRIELMEEAMSLCKILIHHPLSQTPRSYALMALMCFHYARNQSRTNADGEIVLLEDQDRGQWSQEWITIAQGYLSLASTGNSVSQYHLEACIAYEHCIAKEFNLTNWEAILHYYRVLLQINASPIIFINYAAALFKGVGPKEALLILNQYQDQQKLTGNYIYHSLLGEIHKQLNDIEAAHKSFTKAVSLTQSDIEKKLMTKKIAALESNTQV